MTKTSRAFRRLKTGNEGLSGDNRHMIMILSLILIFVNQMQPHPSNHAKLYLLIFLKERLRAKLKLDKTMPIAILIYITHGRSIFEG